MTAEVAVLNRIGVALAADSAVTIGIEANKIYTSAEKLFQLNPTAPLGVMVYGNADFCGLPWETIIKTYRKSHGTEVFDTVADCGKHFIQFLSQSSHLFPMERQDEAARRLIASLFVFARRELEKRLDIEAEQRDGLDEADLPPIIESAFEEILSSIVKQAVLPDFDDQQIKTVASHFKKDIATLTTKIFGELPLTEKAENLTFTLANEMLVRHCFGPMECGLVIAGFGNSEYMPALVNFEIEEMILNHTRSVRTQSTVIGDDSSAAVIPFAQKDMVESFMEGIHSELHGHMKDTTDGLFKGALDQILQAVAARDEKLAQELRKACESGIPEMLAKLFDDWKERRQKYWHPVVQVVASLPKDELAAMAESLVNLTKFRRRISPTRETVGGPIDVAVITKGDGFVWTKRKHYFEPELNPRVISRLQMEK